MSKKGTHITNWYIRENRIIGEVNGKCIITSSIVSWTRYADMRMVTTMNGSVYFIYDDRK